MKKLFYVILGIQLVGNLYGSNGTITLTLTNRQDMNLSPLINLAKKMNLTVIFGDFSGSNPSSINEVTAVPFSSKKSVTIRDDIMSKIDSLKDDYYELDILKAGELDLFLQTLRENFSSQSIPTENREYLIKNLEEIAHDALVSSETAFSEYKGSGKDVIEKIEDGYSKINSTIIDFLRRLGQ